MAELRRSWFRRNKLFYADLILIVGSVIASFILRLNIEQFIFDYLPAFFWLTLIALLVKPVVYYQYGLYHRVWAYASTDEVKLIVRAVTTASVLVAIFMFGLFYLGVFRPFARSLVAIDWLVSLLAVGGLRFGLRLLAENRAEIERASGANMRRALIVGAGDAGALVVRELQKNPQLGLSPVGYLDDDPEKLNQHIHGIPVVGKLNELEDQSRFLHIEEVIMAIPSAPGKTLREVSAQSQRAGIPFRTMPGIYELIGGKVSVNRLREVEITDLLRRQPAQIDRERVERSLKGKRVFITGAGGSIASELCRQIARWHPAELYLLGHGENSIFEILLELRSDFPHLNVQPIIADIRDAQRLEVLLKEAQPDVLFHAAAHKHVPLMEINIADAVKNNVMGTLNVVSAADKAAVPRLVMISTDKAVNPSSVMGATKRVAEWIVLDAAERSSQPFSVVRFGNVLGSRGSVVPLFKQQIESGGPVKVTHPEMERYFMTIPEAVHLVLQSSTFNNQGEVYMLDMGKPVKILELAKDLIHLSGLRPNEDIAIEFSGLRPGEKLSEELNEPGAEYFPTDHPDIRRVSEPNRLAGEKLHNAVKELGELAEKGGNEEMLRLLRELLPGAEVGTAPPPDITSIV
ncbi:MAG: polysaccharide biosynthesis protein [Anaerolineales bacterium]